MQYIRTNFTWSFQYLKSETKGVIWNLAKYLDWMKVFLYFFNYEGIVAWIQFL